MTHSDRVAWLEGFLLDRMVDTQLPGLSFALIDAGQVVHQRGMGFRNIEARQPATPLTLFGLGSVTKVFTAIAVMQLQEQGRLQLDDPLSRYLPVRLSRWEEPVRLWHLLSHSSGLPALGLSESKLSDRWQMTGYPVADADDLLAFLEGADTWAACAPGERWFYLNEGYMLLGVIIEQLSGQPYMDYVRDHVLRPLGMERTVWRADQVAADPDAATPYMLNRDRQLVRGAHLISELPAAGGLISNVSDMTRLLLMLLNGGVAADGTTIISRDSIAALRHPRVGLPQHVDSCDIEGIEQTSGPAAYFTCGLQLQEAFQGQQILSHGGGVMGGTTYIAFMPGTQTGVVLLANGHGYPLSQLALVALAMVRGSDPQQLPFLKRHQLTQRLVGRYESFRGTIRAEVRPYGEWLELVLHFHHEDRIVPLVPAYLGAQEARFFTVTGGRRMAVEFASSAGGTTLLYERYQFRRCE